MLYKFVTAKLLGKKDCRQGAVISVCPLVIRGASGEDYQCEGEPAVVTSQPDKCIVCGLPLGKLCSKCEAKLNTLEDALIFNDIKLTNIKII